ncbi:unnamed protein product [Spodoptera littoralis]|uniref:Serum response factor-binding protein 1 n=1 Tax=Spodoptera littoralis TaxID=7109 RepID=A0A9P0HXV2_SPOLI|nr:unnamed protein product [Spodoptera littoralis]CAH1637447.1 unnamed protein product [Spodoptera littoralis]
MEVGAVKQAFNTEVILLKKNLNQAKIQIIHKLTRKAKQLTEKKAPEQLKEKLKRKAESAVKEVLIIKKIKPKDLAKFMVTHKGELNTFLNKPQVDEEKACARLLLHKALQDKYKFIRSRFSNVPIQDLFMSRLERRKMKKEAKEKQKNKKKGNNKNVVNSEGDWDVEDVKGDSKISDDEGDDSGDEGNYMSDDENDDNDVSGDESDHSVGGRVSDDESEDNAVENKDSDASVEANNVSDGNDEDDNDSDGNVNEDNDSDGNDEDGSDSDGNEENEQEAIEEVSKPIKPNPKIVKQAQVNVKSKEEKLETVDKKTTEPVEIKPRIKATKKDPAKKQKELNKTKNFNEKILQKKLQKNVNAPVAENKTVDPFFITATGENYMSVADRRAPDEVKEEHMRGNRKMRRAAMFGHVPARRPRQNNYNNDRFNGNDNVRGFKRKFDDKPQFDRRNFNDKKNFNGGNKFDNIKSFNNDNNTKRGFNRDDKQEKLHPSWEAKKKKSGILPFEGKKIVFD